MNASQQLLRIYLDESDRFGHKPLYEGIVLKARELGLAGATVYRSPMGFGKTSVIKTSKRLNLSTDLPMVIDIVDVPEEVIPAHTDEVFSLDKALKLSQRDTKVMEVLRDCLVPGALKTARLWVRDL